MLDAAKLGKEYLKPLTNLMMRKVNAFIDMRNGVNRVAGAVDVEGLDKIIKASGDERLINHVALGIAYWKQSGKEIEKEIAASTQAVMKQAEANHEVNVLQHKMTQMQLEDIAAQQKKMKNMMKELVDMKRQKKDNETT